jgi:hypothetical protein
MDEPRRPDDDWFSSADLPPRRPDDRSVQRAAPGAAAGAAPPAARPPRAAATAGGRRLTPAGDVLVAGLVAFGLALLLNAASIERTARSLPFGAERTVAVGLARPVAALSHFLFLDRPSRAASSLLGRTPPEQNAGQALSDLGKPSGGPTAAPSALPTATPAHPLRIWVGGDSMAQTTGAQIVQYARESGVMKATLDYQISTGLSRPDYYSWPRRLRFIASFIQPDVAVAFFGANDGQPVSYRGTSLATGTPAWDELYHQRVGQAMDALARGGRTRVYWVGLPIMKDRTFSRVVTRLDSIFAAEAAKRPGVVYIDTWKMFSTKQGTYADYLRNADGSLLQMRQSDGIHLTLAGASRLGWSIVARIARDYHAPPLGE